MFTTKTVRIVSFGFGHPEGIPQGADAIHDLRRAYRDPHVSPEMRYLTARDSRVRRAVYRTPGIANQVRAIVLGVQALLEGPSGEEVVIAVGCAGGRHRAASVAHICALLVRRQLDVEVELVQRDLDLPVIERTARGDSIQNLASAATRALQELAAAVRSEHDADAAVKALITEHQVPEALAGVLDAAAAAITGAAPESYGSGYHWPSIERADMVGGAGSQIRLAVQPLV
ncbi:RapZ C-terminal domain-containing protein [Kitasatospora kifunensis]|uniref:RapZ C-terminal domain-containing protein n=1 Tax=Kitasatospora kifunensis TaxID=58351 RepID=A0A7W7RBV0_KITKI|nr:RNase adapter RapZ [Kitasatospora kifunensis]MBB4929155.1 hypothetical protein [Kitasatospora kifunensis]